MVFKDGQGLAHLFCIFLIPITAIAVFFVNSWWLKGLFSLLFLLLLVLVLVRIFKKD